MGRSGASDSSDRVCDGLVATRPADIAQHWPSPPRGAGGMTAPPMRIDHVRAAMEAVARDHAGRACRSRFTGGPRVALADAAHPGCHRAVV
eukprot:1522682-Lingulodinium_polyedra.AAC.1